MPGKLVQCRLEIKVPFLSLLEKTNRPLTFFLGELKAPHQLFGCCYFSFCNSPICFVDVPKGREHRSEKCIPRTVGTTKSRQEPVYHVTEKNTKYCTNQTAPHQADDAANQFAPPVGG